MSETPESTYYRYCRDALKSQRREQDNNGDIHPCGGSTSKFIAVIGMKELT